MTRPLRNPGPVERYFLMKSVNGSYPNFSLTATYNLPVTDAKLSHALKALVEEQPWLTYTIYKVDDRPKDDPEEWKIGAVSRINYSDVVSHAKIDAFDDKHLTQLVKSSLTLDDERFPLWRIVIYELPDRSQRITVYVDHAIYDGQSIIHVHKTLCKHLSTLGDVGQLGVIYDENDSCGAAKPLLPAKENNPLLVPVTTDKIGALFKFMSPQAVTRAYDYICSSLNNMVPYKPTNPLFSLDKTIKSIDTKVLSLNLTPAEVEQAVSFCRVNNLTLTPFVHAIIIQCLEDVVFPKVDPNKRFSTKHNVAVDVRKALPGELPFEIGLITSLDIFELAPMQGRLKQLATHLQDRYNRNAEDNYQRISRTVAYLKLLPYKVTKSVARSVNRSTLVLTNVGKVVDPGYTYQIEDMIFAQTVGTTGFLTICIATTQRGGMNTTVSYVADLDEYHEGNEPVMMVFVNELKKRLLGYTSGTMPFADSRL